MPMTYDDLVKTKYLDCSSIEDMRGQYISHKVLINTESTDFAGAVLYGCYCEVDLQDVIEVNPKSSEDEVSLQLQGANLYMATFGSVNLQAASLQGANLFNAYLIGANLEKANLRDADLGNASLVDVNLERANLKRACLRYAKLKRANLIGADLSRVDLQDANLEKADLRGANLQGADLQWANLFGANLEGANLSGASLYEARYDSKTNFKDSNITQKDLDSMEFVEDED